MIEYRALGSLAARSGEEAASLGGPKQRMVLALLLVNVNRVTPIDRLIDGVWGERPPNAARHTVHAYVSELRKVLDGQPEREGPGYVLRVLPEQFDVLRFEALCSTGRRTLGDDPHAALERLSDALSCWEGTPYADLVDEPALDAEIRRLSELRLEALEDRIEANLLAGRHRDVCGELEALVREHPFRERFWRQLMLALYRSGRQAEALRAYGRVRRLLAEELGVSPSPELEILERQILDHDVSLRADELIAADRGESNLRIVRGYELREVIAEGDFGMVYRAYQPSVGRQVAVKAIRPGSAGMATFVQRFEAEEQFIAELEHPHIVPLYDYWRDPTAGYLVMPLLRGGSLATALRRGPWNTDTALHLLDQVGSALACAHRHGIIHRDVKPSNILLDAEGNAYLSDFGLSVRLADTAGGDLTSSAEYMPPETLRGDPLTAAADIFSLAVVTFELLTGVRPAGAAVVEKIAELRPHLPSGLGAVLGKATEDEPARRYESVDQFVHAVRAAIGVEVEGIGVDAIRASEWPRRNPYKGLRAFQETDAADFHGRGPLVDELIRAVSRHRLVCVVGSSGCGKSSVIRAGLIPALRAGSLPGSQSWLITDMLPGAYPFEELETALMRVALHDPGSLVGELRSDERGLLRAIKRILPSDDSELVLVVDQFEELFSLVDDEAARRLFLDSLTTLLSDERGRVRLVVSLRADFFDRPLDYPAFGELLRDGLVAVTPPDDEALTRAITRPANGVGLELETGLSAAMVDDVRNEPGGLPLLQFALTELVHRRQSDLLTIASYRESGGVAAAIGRRAEQLYSELTPPSKEACRQLFLRLVSVGEETDDTRKRVRQSELEALDVDRSAVDHVIQRFASFRLLTFDRDPISRSPTVEVAHEALIREWHTLRGWIDEQRETLVLHRRFTAALREWEVHDRDDAFLLAGGHLAQFGSWASQGQLRLTSDETAFLENSRRTARRRRRRRAILRWTAVGVVAALAVVAFAQRETAQREARHATAGELAAASTLALVEDPERSVLLGLRAVEISRDAGEAPLPEAVGALNDAVQTSRLEVRLPDGAGNVAVSPDGSLLATDSFDPDTLWGSEVIIWDAVTGERLRTLTGEGLVSAGSAALGAEGGRSLAFDPGGDLLAVAFSGGQPETPIIVWDPRSGEEVARLMAPGSTAWNPLWSPDGEWLTAASSNGSTSAVTTWEVRTGRQLVTIESPFIGEIDLYDNETLAITHGPEQRVGFYDLATGEEVDRLETPGLEPLYLAVDRQHQRMAISARHERLEVWDLESRSLLWSRALSSSRRIVVDPSGEVLALTGAEGMVRLLDLNDGSEIVTLPGHNAAVGDVAFTPTGDRLVSVGNDGETRIWSVGPGGSPALGSIEISSGRPFLIDFAPDGTEFGVSTWDGTYERRDAVTGELLGLVDGLMTDALVNPIVSPDWRFLAGVSDDGTPTLWALTSGDVIETLPACTNPRAFSPDGSALVLDAGSLCPAGEAPEGSILHSQVIDLASGDELLDLGSGRVIFRAAFNPGGALEPGRYLAVNADTVALEIYDMDSGAMVARYENSPNLIRFDPSGRYLAAGAGTDVFVVDVVALAEGAAADDAIVMSQFSAPGGVPGIAITSDGIIASSAFDSRFVRLWDLATGDLLAELQTDLDGSSPPHLAFTPDGDQLLYPDAGHVLRRFPLDVDRLVDLAERRVFRELTDDECRRYLDSGDCT